MSFHRVFQDREPIYRNTHRPIQTFMTMKWNLSNLFNNEATTDHNKNAWQVYVGDELIDTVLFDRKKTAWHVRRALVYQEGYPGNIQVVCLEEE